MSEHTLLEKITAHVGGRWLMVLTHHEIRNGISVRDLGKYLEELSEAAKAVFWTEYPNLTDRENVTHAVILSEAAFNMAKTVYAEGEQEHAFGHECLLRIERLLMGTPLTFDERYALYEKAHDAHQLRILKNATDNPECTLANSYTNLAKLPRSLASHDTLDKLIYPIPRY